MQNRVLHWLGSTLKDVKDFPKEVRQEVGFAIRQAQNGGKAFCAVPMMGLGARVLEAIIDHDGDTFRAVYTVRFEKAVYALHAFKKKSKRGIATPKREIDLIRSRLKDAQEHYKQHYEQADKKEASNG